MEELIKKVHIDARVKAKNWEDAIRKTGQLLIESNDINKSYVENMIENVNNLGPYIVVTRGFALAHAAPDPKIVFTPSISLITLENPIKFGSPNDPVTVVMCLASPDQATHIDLLSKITKKLMLKDFIPTISNCLSNDELYNIINEC